MTATPTPIEEATDLALCRSVLYDALALGLRPPRGRDLTRLTAWESSQALLDAAEVVDQEVGEAAQAAKALPGEERERPPAQSAASLTTIVHDLVRAAQAARGGELEAAHERIFGHTARGKVPPYETEYGADDPFRQAEELADLNGFYHAFGLAPKEHAHERGDHIALECEFLSFLACKEAYMKATADEASLEATRRAARLFLKEHLGRFGPAFGRALAREAGHPFYALLGELCSALLARDAKLFGVAAGPELIRLRSDKDVDVPMACGSNCELAQLLPGACEAP